MRLRSLSVVCSVPLAFLVGCRLPNSNDSGNTSRPNSTATSLSGNVAAGPFRTAVSPASFDGQRTRGTRRGPKHNSRPQEDGDAFDDRVLVESKIEIGQIEHWPIKIDIVSLRETGEELLPVVLHMHQGGSAEQLALRSLTRLVSHGKHVGVSVACVTGLNAERPNEIPEFALVMDWLHSNAETYEISPNRVGIWIQTSNGHSLHTLERGTHSLLSSVTIDYQKEFGQRPDGGLFDVEQFFNRQLRGEETDRPVGRGPRGSGRRGGGPGRGPGGGGFGGTGMRGM